VARTVKDTNLGTRAARAKLAARHKPYWRTIDPGRHLGYYKGARGGSWIARRYAGGGRYDEFQLGTADDTHDADGVEVLTFAQAQEKARGWFSEGAAKAGPMIVKQAIAAYVEYLKAEKRTGDDTERRLAKHVPSKLQDRRIAELTRDELDKWKRGMVRRDPEDPEMERRSKDTANRVLTMLKAALNQAFADETKNIPTDKAWRTVKPFHNVGRSRQVHLDPAQVTRLINSTEGAFRKLVIATLLTGSRPAPGEVAQARVRDFRADLHTLSILHSKTGPRDVVLTKEGVRFFEEITAGRDPDALLLPKDDGTAWGYNHQLRPMREAAKRAKLSEGTCMYSLRHTYASQSILAGMNLKLLAENMGTSIRMLEQHYAKFIAASRAKLIEDAAPKLGLPRSNIASMTAAGG
jgi:integrase